MCLKIVYNYVTAGHVSTTTFLCTVPFPTLRIWAISLSVLPWLLSSNTLFLLHCKCCCFGCCSWCSTSMLIYSTFPYVFWRTASLSRLISCISNYFLISLLLYISKKKIFSDHLKTRDWNAYYNINKRTIAYSTSTNQKRGIVINNSIAADR